MNLTYISVDKPIYLKGYNLNGVVNIANLQGCKLTGLGKYNVSGDITTLLNEVGGVKDLTPYGNGVFGLLFAEYDGIPCVDIVDASKLILSATTLAEFCYYYMFHGCTSLVTPPELPATTLAKHCYGEMFENCTSLTTAPILPATELAANCYGGMFAHCTSLVTAPELPATTLAYWCYNNMFADCKSLNYIKCLATDISADGCTKDWVENVLSPTGTFVKHSDMNDWTTSYDGIPEGWTVEDAEI